MNTTNRFRSLLVINGKHLLPVLDLEWSISRDTKLDGVGGDLVMTDAVYGTFKIPMVKNVGLVKLEPFDMYMYPYIRDFSERYYAENVIISEVTIDAMIESETMSTWDFAASDMTTF